MQHKTFLRSLAAFPLPIALPAVQAQPAGYLDKPIRITVRYTPGSSNDMMARVFARKRQADLSQPVVVENKPGAGTVLGTYAGAKATPDCCTLVVVGFPLVVNQYIHTKLPYDTKKDFAPVILEGQTPNLLLARAESPIKLMTDLIAGAKASSGSLSPASVGNDTALHLAMDYFENVTGTELNQIPFKSGAPMVTDLLDGQVDVMFDNPPDALSQVKADKMHVRAVTTAAPACCSRNSDRGGPEIFRFRSRCLVRLRRAARHGQTHLRQTQRRTAESRQVGQRENHLRGAGRRAAGHFEVQLRPILCCAGCQVGAFHSEGRHQGRVTPCP